MVIASLFLVDYPTPNLALKRQRPWYQELSPFPWMRSLSGLGMKRKVKCTGRGGSPSKHFKQGYRGMNRTKKHATGYHVMQSLGRLTRWGPRWGRWQSTKTRTGVVDRFPGNDSQVSMGCSEASGTPARQ